jgi:hypothetical protein
MQDCQDKLQCVNLDSKSTSLVNILYFSDWMYKGHTDNCTVVCTLCISTERIKPKNRAGFIHDIMHGIYFRSTK